MSGQRLKIRLARQTLWVCVALLSFSFAETYARTIEDVDDPGVMLERVRRIVEEIRAASYPEIKGVPIEVKLFDSSSDYFQTRFTGASFLFRKNLRYTLRVNRKLFARGAPEEAVRAIIAHELAHIVYFESRRRLRLLCLVRLASKDFTVRFERSTDLQAIANGYAEGLKSYRQWLYRQVTVKKLEEKKRNYFSPEEIDAILLRLREEPDLLRLWRKTPPRSLQEVGRNAKGKLQ